MDKYRKKFDIISFTADEKQYYPASMKKSSWMPGTCIKHTKIEIPLGKSRYGGPVIDLPHGIEHPKDLRFAAQLDLAEFSPFDKSGLLPKTGQLIFFADIINDTGKVYYADVPNDKLVRTIHEHEDNFFLGILVDTIFADTETFEENFSDPEDGDVKTWNSFAGSGKSKIFGVYTHCQYGQEKIEEITFSDKVLLLQIGENGFNDEGVFSVLINQQDL
jgi:hypothetical protein